MSRLRNEVLLPKNARIELLPAEKAGAHKILWSWLGAFMGMCLISQCGQVLSMTSVESTFLIASFGIISAGGRRGKRRIVVHLSIVDSAEIVGEGG